MLGPIQAACDLKYGDFVTFNNDLTLRLWKNANKPAIGRAAHTCKKGEWVSVITYDLESLKRSHILISELWRCIKTMDIDDIFTYHKPEPGQPEKYEAIRSKAREMAHTIVDNVPDCADRTAAIRKLREAVMTANAAIALKGSV